MGKNRNNMENNNINVDINNTYIDNIKMVERPVKTYSYCWQCGITLDTLSPIPFCCWEHQQEFYAEQRKEADTCYREFCGRD